MEEAEACIKPGQIGMKRERVEIEVFSDRRLSWYGALSSSKYGRFELKPRSEDYGVHVFLSIHRQT